MIAVRDLQIGDFINTENNGVVQITVLSWKGVGYEGGASTPEHCSYIPLTEDILVKNGFDKDERSKYFHVYTLNIKGSYDFDICWSSVNGFNYEGDFMLTYVHQLQHLLRLCGIEKELVID